MVILVWVAERHNAEAAPVGVQSGQEQLLLFLRIFDDTELFQGEAAIHISWFANLILLVEEVGGGERAAVEEPFRVSAAGFALPAPTNNALAGRPEALEKY